MGMEAFFRARGFGRRLGFGIQPCLVVVDLVHGFTDPSSPLGAPMDPVVDAADRLLYTARLHGIPIYFTIPAYEEDDFVDAGLWRLKIAGIETLRLGSRATEVDGRLKRRTSEPILIKKYASAFFGTDLASRLNARSVDTVLIAGCTTSGCVRATAVDAIQYGFRPIVIREAVGDRDPDAHRQSLFDLDQKYADVVSLEEALQYLNVRRTDDTGFKRD